jgi:hypothetical protein
MSRLYLLNAILAVIGTAVLGLTMAPAREVVGGPRAARTVDAGA